MCRLASLLLHVPSCGTGTSVTAHMDPMARTVQTHRSIGRSDVLLVESPCNWKVTILTSMLAIPLPGEAARGSAHLDAPPVAESSCLPELDSTGESTVGPGDPRSREDMAPIAPRFRPPSTLRFSRSDDFVMFG